MCKRFAQLKRLNIRLKRAYKQRIFNGYRAITLLTNKDNRIQTRSIFSALRHAFNIANWDKQTRLRDTVSNIENAVITTSGELLGLKFVISHQAQADNIKHLHESANQLSQVLRTISEYDNVLAHTIINLLLLLLLSLFSQ